MREHDGARLEALKARPGKPGEASFFWYDAHFASEAVKVLPGEIPEHIEIDVTNLTLGHAIHIRDLTIAKGEIVNDGDVSVVSVIASRAEIANVPAAVADPEVIKKGKLDDAVVEGAAK